MQTHKKDTYLRQLICSALFVALAYLMRFVFHFNVGSFLTFELKDAVIAIGGMLLGPLWAVVMSLLIVTLELLTISDTGFYGWLMNFLAVCSYSATASLIYSLRRRISGAVMGLVAGIVAMLAVMIPANLLITPLFTGMPVSAIREMILPLLLPFNAVKAVVNTGVVLLLYKPVTNALYRSGLTEKPVSAGTRPLGARSWWVVLVAVAMIVLGVTVLVFVLGGHVSGFTGN